MAGTFVTRGVPYLLDAVGRAHLIGKVTVDQVYAKYQHERLDLRHPRGGRAKYLESALHDYYSVYLRQLAGHVFDGELEENMARCMRALAGSGSRRAPIEVSNLRRSFSVEVESNSQIVYRLPASRRRMTEEELKLSRRGRRRGR